MITKVAIAYALYLNVTVCIFCWGMLTRVFPSTNFSVAVAAYIAFQAIYWSFRWKGSLVYVEKKIFSKEMNS